MVLLPADQNEKDGFKSVLHEAGLSVEAFKICECILRQTFLAGFPGMVQYSSDYLDENLQGEHSDSERLSRIEEYIRRWEHTNSDAKERPLIFGFERWNVSTFQVHLAHIRECNSKIEALRKLAHADSRIIKPEDIEALARTMEENVRALVRSEGEQGRHYFPRDSVDGFVLHLERHDYFAKYLAVAKGIFANLIGQKKIHRFIAEKVRFDHDGLGARKKLFSTRYVSNRLTGGNKATLSAYMAKPCELKLATPEFFVFLKHRYPQS